MDNKWFCTDDSSSQYCKINEDCSALSVAVFLVFFKVACECALKRSIPDFAPAVAHCLYNVALYREFCVAAGRNCFYVKVSVCAFCGNFTACKHGVCAVRGVVAVQSDSLFVCAVFHRLRNSVVKLLPQSADLLSAYQASCCLSLQKLLPQLSFPMLRFRSPFFSPIWLIFTGTVSHR